MRLRSHTSSPVKTCCRAASRWKHGTGHISDTRHTSQLISYQELLSLMLSITPSLSQAMLMDVPRLKHIILVDQKRTSWPDLPRGIMVQNMAAVQELGSKPENSKSQVAYYFVWNYYMHTIIFAWCLWFHILLLVYTKQSNHSLGFPRGSVGSCLLTNIFCHLMY